MMKHQRNPTTGKRVRNPETGKRVRSEAGDPCCCCSCWIKLVSTFNCDTLAWSTPTIAAKQTTEPTDPRGEWFTADLTNVGCTAYYWKCIDTTAECDALDVGDTYTGAGTPSGIDTAECCDEDPEDPGDPPADGTSCATDSRVFAICTGFAIQHNPTAIVICDSSPPPPDTNAPNGQARVLNGSAGNTSAAFLHPNGIYAFVGAGGAVEWPRRTPGTLVGGEVAPAQFRAMVHSWAEGDPNSGNDGSAGAGTLGASLIVEIGCYDPLEDVLRVRIAFPYRTDECGATSEYAFDSGYVSTSKSNGVRKSVTLGDAEGNPSRLLTVGSVTVSYCCDGP